ncbi:MAG: LptF/LptG family permease [Alphaproteobacteria bacterium]|jgi:lipopolysaccharide export system permease protein
MSRMSVFGLLFRYFAKRHLFWTGLCLLGLTAVVSIIQTVELIRRVSVLKNNTVEVNFLMLSMLNLPAVIDVVLPFALLSGSMLCFNALNRTNEFVVTRGMGTSIWSALSPAFLAAFGVGLFFIMVINPIGSFTAKQYEKQMVAIFGTDDRNLSVTADGIWLRDKQEDRQLIIHGDALDAANVSIINPVIYQFAAPGELQARLRGSAMLLTDTGWMIENAMAWDNDGGRKEIGTLMLATNIATLDIERSTEPPHTIPVYTLPRFIQMLKNTGLPTINHSIHFHQLLALPLLMVGITMLGARFTLRNVNRGRRMQLFTRGVLIATAIFIYGYLMQILGSTFRVPPAIAGWTPAITILLVGAALLARLDES